MSVQRMKLFNLIPLINNHLFGTYFVPIFPLRSWGSSLPGSSTGACPSQAPASEATRG